MYAGEGAEQLRELADKLEERAGGKWPKSDYYRGLQAGLQMAARAARKRAHQLDRERVKAFASNID